MFKKDPIFNIAYPLIMIITAMLGILSAWAGQWNLFFLWAIVLSLLIAGLIYLNGWIKRPDWLKMPEPKKKDDVPMPQQPKAEAKKTKAETKKIVKAAKKHEEKKAIIKKAPPKQKAKPIKQKEENKQIKVYDNEEEDTEPKYIEPKGPQHLNLIELRKPEKKSETKAKKVETEFDQFINLVKEKKEVSLAEIEKKFNLTKEKAEEWARMLESHGLIEIRYPTFGEPKLIYKESKEEL